MKKVKVASALAIVGLALTGLTTAIPAQAATINCHAWMGDRLTFGQTRPKIDCDLVTKGWQARARGDCAAAPDTYTKWIRSYEGSSGEYCSFGARGAIRESRNY